MQEKKPEVVATLPADNVLLIVRHIFNGFNSH
jgi:hypothetical protein